MLQWQCSKTHLKLVTKTYLEHGAGVSEVVEVGIVVRVLEQGLQLRGDHSEGVHVEGDVHHAQEQHHDVKVVHHPREVDPADLDDFEHLLHDVVRHKDVVDELECEDDVVPGVHVPDNEWRCDLYNHICFD